jgi:Tol biopolymer transport system component
MPYSYRVFFITLALFLGISVNSFSQIKLPDVTGPIIQKIPVFIPELSSIGPGNAQGREFVEVLRNDLNNAALFEVSTGGAIISDLNNINFQGIFDAGADYMIAGQYQPEGGKTKFAVQLYNVKEERPILGRTYVATPGKVREAAHKFADLAMKQIDNLRDTALF